MSPRRWWWWSVCVISKCLPLPSPSKCSRLRLSAAFSAAPKVCLSHLFDDAESAAAFSHSFRSSRFPKSVFQSSSSPAMLVPTTSLSLSFSVFSVQICLAINFGWPNLGLAWRYYCVWIATFTFVFWICSKCVHKLEDSIQHKHTNSSIVANTPLATPFLLNRVPQNLNCQINSSNQNQTHYSSCQWWLLSSENTFRASLMPVPNQSRLNSVLLECPMSRCLEMISISDAWLKLSPLKRT